MGWLSGLSCCLILEEEVAAAVKLSGGFGTMRMTDLINNIVKAGCIPDDWDRLPRCLCTRGKVIHLCAVHTEQPLKVLERLI